MDAKILNKANEIMKQAKQAYVGSIDKEGYPNVATRSLIHPKDMSSCFFSTGTGANLMSNINQNNKAGVCIREGGNNISLHGTIEIITDKAIKEQMWLDWFINHFPKGVNDPTYCLLKFTAIRGTLWVDNVYDQFIISEIEQ
ncbi:MAG: pyridoxamine 5'-phosphate oxidase family protein [Clostridia bacterium]|nr:pyridoxamine 5'-phosphate oxidase family protein [Clostridia bacterium]MBT7123477.1 pyridoxamine 5'-phosphate oxidase family protein [Clostridia bacterium]